MTKDPKDWTKQELEAYLFKKMDEAKDKAVNEYVKKWHEEWWIRATTPNNDPSTGILNTIK